MTRQALDEGCTEIEIAVPGDSVDIDFGDDDDVDFILSDENDTPWLKLTDEPNDANTWSYNLTVLGVRTRSEAIRALCESGAVCEVMGHCWRDGRPGEGFSEDDGTYFSYTDYHPGVSFQTCRICGKTETRRWTDWD
ncbi:MAG: hypothetical protein WC907_00970 [Acholeplasmataceae bacterium]